MEPSSVSQIGHSCPEKLVNTRSEQRRSLKPTHDVTSAGKMVTFGLAISVDDRTPHPGAGRHASIRLDSHSIAEHGPRSRPEPTADNSPPPRPVTTSSPRRPEEPSAADTASQAVRSAPRETRSPSTSFMKRSGTTPPPQPQFQLGNQEPRTTLEAPVCLGMQR